MLGVPPPRGASLHDLDHIALQQGQLGRVTGRVVTERTKMLHIHWLQSQNQICEFESFSLEEIKHVIMLTNKTTCNL